MRLLADENFHAGVCAWLRSLGHDVRLIAKGTPDPALVSQAKSESRILLTHDSDFVNTDAYPPSAHAGIILIRINPLHVEKIQGALANLFSRLPEASFRGRLLLLFKESVLELTEGGAASFNPSESSV